MRSAAFSATPYSVAWRWALTCKGSICKTTWARRAGQEGSQTAPMRQLRVRCSYRILWAGRQRHLEYNFQKFAYPKAEMNASHTAKTTLETQNIDESGIDNISNIGPFSMIPSSSAEDIISINSRWDRRLHTAAVPTGCATEENPLVIHDFHAASVPRWELSGTAFPGIVSPVDKALFPLRSYADSKIVAN